MWRNAFSEAALRFCGTIWKRSGGGAIEDWFRWQGKVHVLLQYMSDDVTVNVNHCVVTVNAAIVYASACI